MVWNFYRLFTNSPYIVTEESQDEHTKNGIILLGSRFSKIFNVKSFSRNSYLIGLLLLCAHVPVISKPIKKQAQGHNFISGILEQQFSINMFSSFLSSSRDSSATKLTDFTVLKPSYAPTFQPTIEQSVGFVSTTTAGARNWVALAMSDDGIELVAAVSPSGLFYISNDSGASWTGGDIGITSWKTVAISGDKSFIIIVSGGSPNKMFTTHNSVGWIEKTPSFSGEWSRVAATETGSLVVAVQTASDYVISSTDYGTTWVQKTSAGGRTWASIAISNDGTNLVASAYGGYIYTSSNSGDSWTEQTLSGTRNWCGVIAISSDGTRIVTGVATNGYIYTSDDRGVTWTEQTAAGLNNWKSFSMSSDGKVIAGAVNNGKIVASFTYGSRWADQTAFGSRVWVDVVVSADGTKFAAADGSAGEIYTNAFSPIPSSAPTLSPSGGPNIPTRRPSAVPTSTPNLLPIASTAPTTIAPTVINSLTFNPTMNPTKKSNPTAKNYTIAFCPSCSCPVTHKLVANECIKCPFPAQSNMNKLVPDATQSFLMYEPCSVVGIGIPYAGFVFIITILVIIFSNGLVAFIADDIMQNPRIIFGFLTYAMIPFIDYLTNLTYLLTIQFFTTSSLSAFLLFFLFTHVLFTVVLFNNDTIPKLWILPITTYLLTYKRFSSTILNTMMMSLLCIPIIFINLPFLLPWFVLGSFLFLSHVLSLPFISDAWYGVWTGVDRSQMIYLKKRTNIDMGLLNHSLIVQNVFQTFPLLIIQIVNNAAFGTWSTFAVVSVVFSLLNVIMLSYRWCKEKVVNEVYE